MEDRETALQLGPYSALGRRTGDSDHEIENLKAELAAIRAEREELKRGKFERLTVTGGLYLRTATGILRGALAVVEDGAGMVFMDPEGEIVFSATRDGLFLNGPDGTMRAKMSLSEDDKTPLLILADPSGTPRASISNGGWAALHVA